MMRRWIVGVTVTGVFLAGALAWRIQARERSLAVTLSTVEKVKAETVAMQRRLAGLPVSGSRKITEVYAQLLNCMTDAAKILGLGLSVDLEGGIRPATLPGLNEMRMQIVFGGITRRGTLVSLFTFLDSCQAKVAFLVEEIDQQKDTLRLKILLLGV